MTVTWGWAGETQLSDPLSKFLKCQSTFLPEKTCTSISRLFNPLLTEGSSGSLGTYHGCSWKIHFTSGFRGSQGWKLVSILTYLGASHLV